MAQAQEANFDPAAKSWADLHEAVRSAGHYLDLHASGVIATLDPNARVLAELKDALRNLRFHAGTNTASTGSQPAEVAA